MSDTKKSSIAKGSTCYLLNLKQPSRTLKRLKLSFQRTAGKLFILKADRAVDATVGYLDVSENGAGVFTTELLNKGTLVELYIAEPAVLKVRGVVAWSIPVTSGIHHGRFRFRSGIHFVFEVDAQQNAVKEFVEKVSKDPIEILKETGLLYLPPSGNNAMDPKPPVPIAAVPTEPAPPAATASPADSPAPVAPSATEASAPVAPSPADSPGPVAPSTTEASAPVAPSTGIPEGGGQQAA